MSQLLDQIKPELSALMDEDISWFSDMTSVVRDTHPRLAGEALREKSLQVIEELLRDGFMCAGKWEILDGKSLRVRRWPGSVEEIMARISALWDRLDSPFTYAGAICEFDRPEDCLPPLEETEGGESEGPAAPRPSGGAHSRPKRAKAAATCS